MESRDVDENYTNGQYSAYLAEIIAEFESIVPPPEVATLHNTLRSASQNIKDAADRLPTDEALDIEILGPLGRALVEDLREVTDDLPDDVRNRMLEAGCIDDDAGGDRGDTGGKEFDEPKASLGTFRIGDRVLVGAYQVEVTDTHIDDEGRFFVKLEIENVGIKPIAMPNCDANMRLTDQDGVQYARGDCYSYSGPSPGGKVPSDAVVKYSVAYPDAPTDTAWLIWQFSNGMTGASFLVAAPGQATRTASTDPTTDSSRRVIRLPVLNRLEQIRERGSVVCAIRNHQLPGFSHLDDSGGNVGFGIDLCRAVAVAALGDADAVEFRPTTALERGQTMRDGEADILVMVPWTSSRDQWWGNFVPTMFYDGQGFMVHKASGITSTRELKDASVCVQRLTTAESNLVSFSNRNGLNIKPVTFEEMQEVLDGYERKECDGVITDRSYLAVLRLDLADPGAHVFLPETISEEPLSPVVPHGDEQWFDIVKMVMGILIHAEALGVDSTSVPSSCTNNRDVDRLFGILCTDLDQSGEETQYVGVYGQEELGLSPAVAQDVILAVGNYGEIYERNLGSGGLGLPREGSRNALWADAPCVDCPKGGQIYAAPLR